jgi:small subunit ribosomal protein S2
VEQTPVVTMRQLLEAGVHFGHQTRRWNPKMKRFIYGERKGIYIIDLQQTLSRIETAYSFIRDLTAEGGTVLFVGTKKQAQDSVREYAERCGMPYVNERWLGGMLTNFETISKRVGKMKDFQRQRAAGEFEAMPKKEALQISRELEKLERNLGGIRGMDRRPDAVFILDTKKEDIAVTEANKLGIPIVAVVDTNCDPDIVQYVIPGNDDAIRSGNLMCRVVSDAVEEGRYIASKRGVVLPPPSRTPEQEAAYSEQRRAEQSRARSEAAAAAAAREARVEENLQSAAENTRLATGDAVPHEPGLSPENASNLLDDASAVTQDEIAAERETPAPRTEQE